MTALILLTLISVTVGPGWSNPVVVTDSANTKRRVQFIYMNDQDHFHLVWAGYNDEHRIGYKMFDINGNTLFPETMISRDVNSAYLSTIPLGDTLYSFWREYDPVYTAARNFVDGREELPFTYLFTSLTWIPQIRGCPDSLGRLHVLYNDGEEGMDLYYEVWSPAPVSGFNLDYGWRIPGVDEAGSILVDGNRVHIVTKDSLTLNYAYLQYDLEGNIGVPLTSFTENYTWLWRFPTLELDPNGDLLVFAYASPPGVNQYSIYLWKIDSVTGTLLLDEKRLFIPDPPIMDTGPYFVGAPTPVEGQFHICWIGYAAEHKIFHQVSDSDGIVVHNWQLAYDYSDEDPEDLQYMDGISDDQGNLYLIYNQAETEPVLGGYPTFGWLDYSTLGIEGSSSGDAGRCEFTVSQNPVTGLGTIRSTASELLQLKIYDMSGREVSEISVSGGVGVWNGRSQSGEKLPAGIYNIVNITGSIQRVTLLNQ